MNTLKALESFMEMIPDHYKWYEGNCAGLMEAMGLVSCNRPGGTNQTSPHYFQQENPMDTQGDYEKVSHTKYRSIGKPSGNLVSRVYKFFSARETFNRISSRLLVGIPERCAVERFTSGKKFINS